MTENMKIAMTAINKWLFHGWNYESVLVETASFKGCVPQFLKEVKWTCNLDHMIEKWHHAVKSRNTDAYLPAFYANLDGDNRKLLLEWILQNYNGEKPLF